eukprot:2777638-Karenia_brevis.AAC.1
MDAGIERNFDNVFKDFLRFFTGWDQFRCVENYEFKQKTWATPFANMLDDIPWRLAKTGHGSDGLDCFTYWFQSEMPPLEPILAVVDGMVEYMKVGEGNLLKQ